MKRLLTIFVLMSVAFLLGWFVRGARDYDPQSSLQWQFVLAADRGDLTTVQSCFARGARIDAIAADDSGYVTGSSALLEAVESGRMNVVEWLLSHGANPNLIEGDGSGLALDAAEGHLTEANKIIDLLKQHGAKHLSSLPPEP